MTHPILELQAADTMADQLRHRREHLPEREQLQAAKNALVRWNEARMVTRKRVEELGATIEQAERDSHEIDTKLERLHQQLKTVIAPREAEALQHEIAALRERRGELDDVELSALEEQSIADDELRTLLDQEGVLTETYIAADKREQHLIAAATLAGSRCEGCHLDLSAAEVDTVKDSAAKGGLADCPQCGRLLAV